MIEEKDILAYLDGNSTLELRSKVDAWRSESAANEEEFEFTKMMWEESSAASDYVRFDVKQEWDVFESMIDAHVIREIPKKVHDAKIVQMSNTSSWRTGLSMAASILVLISATWFLWPESEYIDIVDAKMDTELLLEDGSLVSIKKGADFKTKRSYRFESKRNVDIAGEVRFDIASDPDKPFIVRTEESAVEVLGTIFDVKTEGVEATVANEEGLVKFFVIEDTSQFVPIKEGESFKYDGSGFIDVTPKPEPLPEPEPEPTPTVTEMIGHLNNIGRGKVTFGSGVADNALSELDIDYKGKSILEIVRLLEEKAIVVYTTGACPECIQIQEIIPRRR